MTKGIVDPWRVVSPLRPEPEKPQRPAQKIDPSQIDLDAELRITQYYVLSSRQGSVRIDSKDITTETDAVNRIISALMHISRTKPYGQRLQEAGVGLEIEGKKWNVPTSVGAHVKTDTSVLYFADVPYDQGMLALIKALNLINREDRNFLKKYGLSTLMR
jgi:hypothetical protein